MNQHLAPIMNRRPLTAGRHNSRQRLPKPQTVSETPQNKQTPMRRDLIAAPRHPSHHKYCYHPSRRCPFQWDRYVS